MDTTLSNLDGTQPTGRETTLSEATPAADVAGISTEAETTTQEPTQTVVAKQPAASEETPAADVTPAVEPEASTSEAQTAAEDEAQSSAEQTADDADGDEATAEQQPKAEEMTCETLLNAVLTLLQKEPDEYTGEEINRLRQRFNMLHSTEEAQAKAAAEDAASTPESDGTAVPGIEPTADTAPTLMQQFEAAIAELRARKAARAAELEAIRAANLERKNAIIKEIVELADDTDNVNRTFPRYRELQDEFNAIGEVDPSQETAIWKRFQDAREQYSDNLKINKELRDYDFKKNLAEKEALLAEARTLAMEEDVITAYRRLQDLHNRWRQIGPVAKELREQIWENFRQASAEINKRYQAYFEERKARESANEEAKTALCERIEAVDVSGLNSFNAWEEATETVKGLQSEWRTLGYAPKKANHKLFNRFRSACDAFFAAKSEYYRNTREKMNDNLSRKTALADEAESLAASTDWRKTGDRLIAMQKEWRTIGAVPKKYSDALWKRFTAACDAFFDARKKSGADTRQVETANLKAKREIIGRLSALISEDVQKDEAIATMRELQARWNEIGHVPFREKDKVYTAYREAVDAVRAHFDIAERNARRERYAASVEAVNGDDDKLYRERERLMRAVETRRSELRTYENNLGFLSSKSKTGDSLVRDMERRIERIKADIEELLDKVKLIDDKAQ